MSSYAYADPPYLGCCKLYDHHHPDGLCWDDPETHRLLIERLSDEWPDGWALSLSTPSLKQLLALCPDDVRPAAWCKSFASFKPNVNPAYCWEPVIFRGGRNPRSRDEPTVRDFHIAPITLRRGLTGAKPESVCRWILDFLGWQLADTMADLYPGTGVMGRVVAAAGGELQYTYGESA